MKFLTGTVYSKALAIFLAASLLLLGTVVALAQLIILREFYTSEQREMKAMLQRFSMVMARETGPLESAAGEWSRSPGKETFSPAVLREFKVDFAALYDQNGKLVRLSAVDSQVEKSISTNPLFTGARGVEIFFHQSGPRSGYLVVDGQLCAVSTRALGNREDGSEGFLVVGKIFNQTSWGFFEGLFSATVRFHPFGDINVNESSGLDMARLLVSQEVVIDSGAENQIVGYRLISGVDGAPIGYVSISQPRFLRQEGLRAIQVFLTGIILAGGALVMVIWLLLDRTILARIKELTRKVESGKRSGRLPVKLDFFGQDELGTLARGIEDLASLLQQTQSQYRTIVEDQTEMICRFDQDLNLVFANEIFLRIFQLERDQLGRFRIPDLLPGDNGQDFARRFGELNAEGSLATFTSRLDLGSRGVFWFRNTLRRSFSPEGSCTGGQWVAADITAQIEAERQKFESARRFRLLFETASDGILLVRGENRVIADFNASLCQMLLLAGPEMLDHSLEKISIFAPCLSIVKDYQLLGLNGAGRGVRNECRLERADGSALYVEIRCSSYKTNEDVYIQLNFRNISDRVHGEREMRRLSARLLRLQDEERRRIARELHDSTAQNLSALEMNMSLLEPLLDKTGSRARRLAEDTRRIAGECSRELRNISYLLHPPLIDEVGLPFAIKWFADGFAKRTGIAATVEIEENFPRLGSDLEMPLFRVVQEAMTNIYRHSGADRAWVSLRCEGRVVLMEIRDNGSGFKNGVLPNDSDNSENSGGFGVGIAGMTERIANCGGKLEIEDSPLGVTISIRLLLNASHAAH